MQKAHAFALLFVVAAVFSGVPYAEGGWDFVVSESGRMEIFDDSEELSDSGSTSLGRSTSVYFHLYTSSNTESSQLIYLNDDDTLAASNFDASKPTRFLIHGWFSSVTGPFSIAVRDAYLAAGDYNVIVVDWSAYAGLGYIYASAKVATTGQYVGSMIDYLETQGMSMDDLIVVGHSLGAHVAGNAGRTTTNTMPALIGLDPAGPLFKTVNKSARLKSTDAEYVQVVHTNAGRLGYNGNLGDADFWPNGGKWQAGCNFDVFGQCSHLRSFYFLAESIVSSDTQFVAYSCDSYSNYAASSCSANSAAYMGGSSLDVEASGDYYLDTNSASPYAMG